METSAETADKLNDRSHKLQSLQDEQDRRVDELIDLMEKDMTECIDLMSEEERDDFVSDVAFCDSFNPHADGDFLSRHHNRRYNWIKRIASRVAEAEYREKVEELR